MFDLPVNSSCTYRVMSRCGYPQASWRVNDPLITEDFDIAWATQDGLTFINELDYSDFNHTTDIQGSYISNKTTMYTHISQPSEKKIG